MPNDKTAEKPKVRMVTELVMPASEHAGIESTYTRLVEGFLPVAETIHVRQRNITGGESIGSERVIRSSKLHVFIDAGQEDTPSPELPCPVIEARLVLRVGKIGEEKKK